MRPFPTASAASWRKCWLPTALLLWNPEDAVFVANAFVPVLRSPESPGPSFPFSLTEDAGPGDDRTGTFRRGSCVPPVVALQTRRRVFGDIDDDDADENSGVSLGWPETSFGSEAVPEGQRPVNEYLDLLRQPLFDWALDTPRLLSRCAITYAAFLGLVAYPIAGATFTLPGYLWPKLASSHVGALGVVLLLLLRLSAGWNYVGNRLTDSRIEYEETGWYDGTVETKTLAEQKRDKFLYQSTVRPVVKRINAATLGAALAMLASIWALQFALERHPRFDQYDPAVLEQMRYDEDLAERAAAAANEGRRPTYCDSRYYRAVAGGAPGCQ